MPLRKPRGTREDGFTLVEVLVALTLFGILAGTVSVALGALLKQVKNNQNRTVATNIAQRIIDRVHALDFDNIPLGQQPPQQFQTGGQKFQAKIITSLVPEGAGATTSPCDGVGALSAVRVSVELTWDGMGTTKPVRSDALRAQTVKDIDPTKGNITVKILDRNNVAAADHQVTLNPGARTFTVGADGCAVFTLLAPGPYTVSLSSPGYVDPVGDPAPDRPVTAVAGATVKDPGFSYDKAGKLDLSWTLTGPSTFTDFPVLLPSRGAGLGNSAFTAGARSYNLCGVEPCATAVPTGLLVAGLYPSAEGYRPWAGACTDAKPTALPAAEVLAPGELRASTVLLAPVQLTLTKSDGTALAGGTVKIKHAADSVCTPVSTTLTAVGSPSVIKLSMPGGVFTFQVNAGPVQTATLVPGSAPLAVTVKSS